MKNSLLKFCRALNIEYVGIAPAEPFHDYEAIWIKRQEQGHVTGFEEKNTAKRINPGLSLESCKSIIVCLFPYYVKAADFHNLSRSAFSIDYHLLVREKLQEIANYLGTIIDDFQYQIYVDNGPLSDRHLAWRAGLGFWGVNNCLINEKYGSYVFIGSILNNYPFEPDQPQEKSCMKCWKCVMACPGQCISKDFYLNPLICKSYLTQKKGELSQKEQEIMAKTALIWGCDICQEVCPHNEGIKETPLEEFRKNLIFKLDHNELQNLSNREFLEKYGNRSFSWRGKNILLRNHRIVSGISE